MSFNPNHEIKILAKISEFTVTYQSPCEISCLSLPSNDTIAELRELGDNMICN